MIGMFENSVFNKSIASWNVGSVLFMCGMFKKSKFKGNLSQWNVSKVTNMGTMFEESSFNGDISKWDVSKVKHMYRMFMHSAFRGNLSNWSVPRDSEIAFMIKPCVLNDFKEPSFLHWNAVFTNAKIKRWPTQWQQHFHDFAPFVRSLGLQDAEAACMMQNLWNERFQPLTHIEMNDFSYAG